MRLLPSILTLASCLATSTIAHADPITWIVSIVGSGSLGAQTFTDKRITLIDTTTTEYYYEFADFGGPGFAICCVSGTVTVEGIGTFESAAVEVDTEFSGGGLEIADIEDRLSIASGLQAPNTPETIGPVFGNGSVIDGCDPDFGFPPCPGFISTDDGELLINSFVPNSATGQEIFNPVPEPSTFLLVGTGLLSASGLWRRRFHHH